MKQRKAAGSPTGAPAQLRRADVLTAPMRVVAGAMVVRVPVPVPVVVALVAATWLQPARGPMAVVVAMWPQPARTPMVAVAAVAKARKARAVAGAAAGRRG